MEKCIIFIQKILKKLQHCEIVMIEIKHLRTSIPHTLKLKTPSNVKPDSWYEEYIKKHDEIVYSNDPKLIQAYEPQLEIRVKYLKESDRDIDVYNILGHYLAVFENIQYNIYYKQKKRKNDKEYLKSREYEKDNKKLERLYKLLHYKIPLGTTKEQLNNYYNLFDSWYGDVLILFEYNTIQKNLELIKEFEVRLKSLKGLPELNRLDSYELLGWERCVLFTMLKLKLCKNIIAQGYLVSRQLYIINDDIVNYEDDIECEGRRKHPESIEDLDFRDFKIPEGQIFKSIRKNEKWFDIDRDLVIYQERQKGKYLDELAENFGIKFNSISMVVKKVQSAINFYQGKEFENFVYKRLLESKLFKLVKKEAGKGESDILAYTKDDKGLYIYSLKNIKINRKPYWLKKEELRPELETAVLSQLDYDVQLILLVFDNYSNKAKQFKIDFNNPRNIDISK